MEKQKYNWPLKKMIVGKGLKQTWLANKCKVDAAVFTKWITCERECPPAKKLTIADLLGCEVPDIFEE